MAKAVLISIRPGWAEKILSGEKTLEVRKTRPKLETPFKVYIYCTAGNLSYEINNGMTCNISGGKLVVGEFVCDNIRPLMAESFIVKEDAEKALLGTSLTSEQIKDYAGWKGKKWWDCKDLYKWHISNLKIYDMPKPLYRFKPWNHECKYNDLGIAIPKCGTCHDCTVEKPPQSWCYVEEL